MDSHDVKRLEEACERAMADVLRKHYASSLHPRVCHLMAKAAVSVLEAVSEDFKREHQAPPLADDEGPKEARPL